MNAKHLDKLGESQKEAGMDWNDFDDNDPGTWPGYWDKIKIDCPSSGYISSGNIIEAKLLPCVSSRDVIAGYFLTTSSGPPELIPSTYVNRWSKID